MGAMELELLLHVTSNRRRRTRSDIPNGINGSLAGSIAKRKYMIRLSGKMVSECQEEGERVKPSSLRWVMSGHLMDDDKASDPASTVVNAQFKSQGRRVLWTVVRVGRKWEGMRGPTSKAARRQSVPAVAEMSLYD